MYNNPSIFRPLVIVIITIIVFFSNAGLAGTKIYKWINAEGEVIYSQSPPPRGIGYERIKEAPQPAADPAAAMQSLRERADAFTERRNERLEIEEKGEEAAAQAKRNREICDQLRKNLTGLQSGKQVRVKGKDGNLSIIGEEQRKKKVAATQTRIKNECTNSNS